MARDRQRAKQRQAERRAARLAEAGSGSAGAPRADSEAAGDGVALAGEPAAAPGSEPDRGPAPRRDTGPPPGLDPETGADLAASAPPEAIGRSDTVVEVPPPPLAAEPDLDPEAAASRGGVERSEDDDRAHDRNKVVAFLIASWAELQRVQWPNRQQLTTLTAVVFGFVIVMGAYLGLLDLIFSRLVQGIL